MDVLIVLSRLKKVVEDVIRVRETKDKGLCQGERRGNIFKDRVLNKVFHADLVGALDILRVGAKLLELRFYENLKVLFIKLCNPLKMKLMDFFYKVSPESLFGIGGSRQGIFSPCRVDGKTGLFDQVWNLMPYFSKP